MTFVRAVEAHDVESWAKMRHELWPDATLEELRSDARRFFEDKSVYITAAFIALKDEEPAGFIELNLRAYAEGCEHSPVPHIEAWHVVPALRRTGIGTALMRAAEEWALSNGYSELTSDTNESYPSSPAAHAANGFDEVERLICFRKKLR